MRRLGEITWRLALLVRWCVVILVSGSQKDGTDLLHQIQHSASRDNTTNRAPTITLDGKKTRKKDNEHESGSGRISWKDKGKEREQATEEGAIRDNYHMQQQPLGEGMNLVRPPHSTVYNNQRYSNGSRCIQRKSTNPGPAGGDNESAKISPSVSFFAAI